VVELWKGLGYNRRAVHLHACATAITAEHDGRVPAVLEDLLTLPGIGPYTARAVLVFAFERDVAVLDTNVGRVLARLDGRTYSSRDAQARADDLVPSGSAWRWNQSLLDFGSTTCTKRAPHCDRCVIRSACAWQGVGRDPADGSAGVPAPQSTFAGSDRQGRGPLIDELRDGPVREADLAEAMGWPGDEARARRVADRVVADGLAVVVGDRFVLPGRR
jgi:A/G-specific adenine glycosylase